METDYSYITSLQTLPKPSVIMSVGAPGCGKTTHMKHLAQTLNAVLVSSDDVRQWLQNSQTDHSRNTLIWRVIHDAVQVAIDADQIVVLDAMNTSPTFRAEQIELYSKFGAKELIALHFTASLTQCLERNAARTEKNVPEDFIKKAHQHSTEYPPSVSEGFDRVIVIE